MDKHAIKGPLFDSLFFTLSVWQWFYLGAWLITGPASLFDQETITRILPTAFYVTLGVALLMLAAAYLFRRTKVTTLGQVLFHQSNTIPPTFLKSFYGIHLLTTLLLTFAISLQVTGFSLTELTDPDGVNGALRLYDGLIHANLNLFPTALIQVIQTVFIAFLATVLALPVAFVLAFLSAKNLMTHPLLFVIYALLRTVLNVGRSVEPLIWALIFTVWVGVGPFAGMLALMIHSVASLAKQFSEIVEDVASGPVEGVLSTGARPLQVIWFGVVPQVLLQFVAFTIYRWDTNVRMATVIGLVGGGGIGTLLLKYQGQAMWPEVGCIILVIAIAVWLMDVASAYIREALR